MTDRTRALLRWLREPLLHFLLAGAILFALFHWRSAAAPDRIVITPGQVDALEAAFRRTWQRPPDEKELKTLLDEQVREEIAAREAMAKGLDRDDTVIRRRLRQKFEFLVEEGADGAPPTQAQLQEWLASHPDKYRSESRVSFRQVHLSPDRRGASLASDAQRLLAQLGKAGPDADIRDLGDSRMLPVDVEGMPRAEVARVFGDDFAKGLLALDPRRWSGPIRSGYGVHLVLLKAIDGGQAPELAQVRTTVERDFAAQHRRKALDALYARLLDERYRVVVEKRVAAASGTGAAK